MYFQSNITQRQMEGWLAAISEVLAVMLSGNVSDEDRARCKNLLAAWSGNSLSEMKESRFQIAPGNTSKVPGREALPALFALLDEK